jgi:hypothetical protein
MTANVPHPHLCHCGLPLHYKHKYEEDYANFLNEYAGEYIIVKSEETKRSYKVPRHYIILHSVTLSELDKLGFEEVTKEGDNNG